MRDSSTSFRSLRELHFARNDTRLLIHLLIFSLMFAQLISCSSETAGIRSGGCEGLPRIAGSREIDRTVNICIPGTNLERVGETLRDAGWIANSTEREPEIRAAFAMVLDLCRSAVFWDVGANIGFYSWLVRQHASVREVVLFEPDPVNFALLTRTIRRNKIENCRVQNVALADRAGEAAFLVDPASGAAGSLATARPDDAYSLHHAYRLRDTIPCRTATVDDLITEGVPARFHAGLTARGGGASCFRRRGIVHCPQASCDDYRNRER